VGGVALAGMLYSNLSWISIAPCCLLLHRDGLGVAPDTNVPLTGGCVSLVGRGIRNRNSGFQRRQLPARWQFLVLAHHIETARSLAANWRYPTAFGRTEAGTVVVVRRVAGIAAVLLLPSRLRKGAIRHNAAGVLFSALLSVTVAVMASGCRPMRCLQNYAALRMEQMAR